MSGVDLPSTETRANPAPARSGGDAAGPWVRAVLHYSLLALLFSLAIVVGAAVIRATRVQRAVNSALRRIEAGDATGALIELQRTENLAAFHPECLYRVDLVAILAYARSGRFDLAERLAQDLAARETLDAPRGDVWDVLAGLPAPLVSWLLRVWNGGVAPDARSGLALVERERLSAPARVAEPPRPARESATDSGGRSAVVAAETPARAWAVVTDARARVYDLSGKVLGRLEPGTILDIASFHTSSTGTVARCTRVGDRLLGAPVLVRVEHLELQKGDLAAVSPEERALRAQRARLLAQREEWLRTPDARNPHKTEYERLRAAYREFWRKAKELEQKRDASTGEERMRYMDELRLMKGEDERLGRALEGTKERYDAWNAEHPKGGVEDSEFQRIEQEIAALDRELSRREASR